MAESKELMANTIQASDTTEPTVYIVDDDNDLRRSLEVLFTDEGLPVRSFASPEEFLNTCDASLKGCLVLDLEMPKLNGLALYERLADRGCSLPFIMITGYGEVPDVIDAFHKGAIDFIQKLEKFVVFYLRIHFY